MKWAVYFLALIRQCDRQVSDEICQHLEMAPRLRKIFTTERFHSDDTLISLERSLPSRNNNLYAELIGFKTELILYMMAVTRKEPVKRAISHFITNLKETTISICGDDLRKLGLAPGPIYRRILDQTLNAKLNGQLNNRTDELKFVKRTVQNLPGAERLQQSPAGEDT